MPSRSPNYSEQRVHNQIGTKRDLRFSYQLCYLWQLYDKAGHKTPKHFHLVVLLQPVKHVDHKSGSRPYGINGIRNRFTSSVLNSDSTHKNETLIAPAERSVGIDI